MSRNLPSHNEVSKIIFDGTVINSSQILIVFTDILSPPWTLFQSDDFICNISFSVTWKDFNQLLVWYEGEGRALVFFIGVHIKEKK